MDSAIEWDLLLGINYDFVNGGWEVERYYKGKLPAGAVTLSYNQFTTERSDKIAGRILTGGTTMKKDTSRVLIHPAAKQLVPEWRDVSVINNKLPALERQSRIDRLQELRNSQGKQRIRSLR